MKHLYSFLILLTGCAFSGYLAYHLSHQTSFPSNKNITIPSGANANEEDGLYQWELMRLADPATGQIPDHIRNKELAFAATLPDDNNSSRSNTWNNRGPWNVGGRTRAFAMDIANNNILIAGSVSGGIYRSTDDGSSWTNVTPSNSYHGITCLVQDKRPGKTNIWYAGSGEASGTSASGGSAFMLGNGLLKSTDNGMTWDTLNRTVTNTPQTFESFWDLNWNIASDNSEMVNDEVYVATLGAIFRSIDGGTHWTQVRGNSFNAAWSYFTDVQVTSTGVVYATLGSDGGGKGIWRSTDGVNYTKITPPNFPSVYDRIVIGISPSDENQIYFLANTPGFGIPDTNFLGDVEWNSLWKYTYISGNGDSSGGAWQDRSLNLPSRGGPFDKFTSQGSYDLVVKVKPDDPNTVFIGGTDLFRSTTGFADTTHTAHIGGYEIGTHLPLVKGFLNHHPDQHVIFFKNNDPLSLYSANDGGVFKTMNDMAATVSWQPLNNGYLTSMFYTVAIDHAASNNIIVGGAQDNGSWFTNNSVGTTPWVTPRGGDGSYCAIADNHTDYYISIQNGKTMKAHLDANGGVIDFARIDPIGAKDFLFINPFILDPLDNNIIYMAAGRKLWKNFDLSGIPMVNNWDSISTNWISFPDTITTATGSITALAAGRTSHRLYYGTSNKRVYRIDNANAPFSNRVDITSVTTGNFFPNGYVTCIAVDPLNDNNVMVVFSNYNIYSLFYSTDAGASWTKVAGNLEQNISGTGNGPSLRWASIIPVSDGTVYLVATSTGMYATDILNGTSTVWTQQSSNLIGHQVCDMIDSRTVDGLTVIATHSNGIFSNSFTSINDIVSSTKKLLTVDTYNLKCFPNPFSKTTTINFSLAKSSTVKIDLIDITGRVLINILDAYRASGSYDEQINATSLNTAIYFCRLTVNGHSQTILVVKG